MKDIKLEDYTNKVRQFLKTRSFSETMHKHWLEIIKHYIFLFVNDKNEIFDNITIYDFIFDYTYSPGEIKINYKIYGKVEEIIKIPISELIKMEKLQIADNWWNKIFGKTLSYFSNKSLSAFYKYRSFLELYGKDEYVRLCSIFFRIKNSINAYGMHSMRDINVKKEIIIFDSGTKTFKEIIDLFIEIEDSQQKNAKTKI